MFAVFHQATPAGFVATCEAHPEWSVLAGTLNDSLAHAERSLRTHIADRVTFSHYLVPPVNDTLRDAA